MSFSILSLELSQNFQTFSNHSRLLSGSEVMLLKLNFMSMQRLENELQMELFERSKNKITFSPTGELAVEYAKKVIGQMDDMILRLRSFERSQHTIAVGCPFFI